MRTEAEVQVQPLGRHGSGGVQARMTAGSTEQAADVTERGKETV